VPAEPQDVEQVRVKQSVPRNRARKIALWVVGVPIALLLTLYLVLLITPVRLPFGNAAVQAAVSSAVPESVRLELGDVALALEGGVWPVIQFSPVVVDDMRSGAHVEMDALRIGFSPVRALLGQPGATVTVLGPKLQVVQDLFGPRPTRFELVDNVDGGPATLRVIEGLDQFPTIEISESGVQVDGVTGSGEQTRTLRSDNEWLIYNLQASEIALRDVIAQTQMGRFSRLVVRDAHIDMSDSLYGLMRSFTEVSLDLRPLEDGTVSGQFNATLAGRTMTGVISRSLGEGGASRLQADITNIDFASFMPFLDDPDSVVAVRGAGQVSIDVGFAAEDAAVEDGRFRIDVTGLDLRIRDDHFPIASSILEVGWEPDTGTFTMEEGALQIAGSSASVSGVFRLGLDDAYGPTIAMSVEARELVIAPNDMEPPEQPFDTVEFVGWSAPLYGAMGIDRLVAQKGEGRVETAGRIDMLRAGLGFDISVAGEGISADDLKRLWPYIMGGESRDWFVVNVTQGMVARSTMRFNFPVGTIGLDGENAAPLPDGAMQVEIVGTDVAIRPTAAFEPIAIEGELLFQLDDTDMSVSASGGTVPTESGDIRVSSPAIVMDNSADGPGIFEVSGDISAGIPALVALIRQQQPEALANAEIPIDLDSITGSVDLGLLATIGLAETEGEDVRLDYVLNGTVSDFASTERIADRLISDGQLQFSASQQGFQLGGTASLDGMDAEVEIVGEPEADPIIRLASTIDVADLADMGFDASDFLTGQVRFVAQPLPEERLAISIDLERAGVTIEDLGIAKAVGTAGSLNAVISQDGEETSLSDIALSFGDVELAGGLVFHATEGLRAAELTQVKLSPGDSAQATIAPISGGYAVNLRGAQLDLKPVLRRYFSLGEGSGGVSTEDLDQTIDLQVNLDRAVGFYGTTAFNVDMDMLLAGSDLRRANLSANFTQGNGISVTTNPTPEGRVMNVAFNDLGTVLRLVGVYSQLAGGSGNLVLNRDTAADIEAGELSLANFAIVDEQNVAQILGNHSDSRTLIAARNRLDFESALVRFNRTTGRIEVTQAMLSGDSVGGTMRGFVYTDARQYDLTGTYVPLFGLNNAFQQIPLLGPILGGRQGEGLFGVTFAVRGPLDQPDFRINPLSALVPGAFRELFEFRAQTGRPVQAAPQ